MEGSSVRLKGVVRITPIEGSVKTITALLTSIHRGIDVISATRLSPSKKTGRITTRTPTMAMT